MGKLTDKQKREQCRKEISKQYRHKINELTSENMRLREMVTNLQCERDMLKSKIKHIEDKEASRRSHLKSMLEQYGMDNSILNSLDTMEGLLNLFSKIN